MSNAIRVKHLDNILILAIERPERKNALTHEMYDFLAHQIGEAEKNPEVRVLLLTGTAECFTSGNDVGDFLKSPPTGDSTPVCRFMNALMDCPKPVIASINGAAVGIGTTLLLHCDMVFAGPDTKLQTPFTRLGLCPEYASSITMPALLGHQKAFEMLIAGDVMTADQALAYGLVNVVSNNHQEKALDKARQIAKLPPASVRLGKSMLRQGERDILKHRISEEIQAFSERLGSPEAKEAFQAFMEKRKPDFSRFE
ncbi:enoyl-CoA hydratase [Sansalvadorimonas sp. 2012CJ34-2]|uniref:Enoyl-CoA hydratase n=1 Tax=Parendozoicomonas callyspongiae TaxID=2942213 RepID=A0ABT0PG53_9GAMM|nr:enoyl-CoA hydratase [Sansalvadorimonas sp. 2012CJ34-2]MCL6270363.1 enoyl-CoA hydratase [Sansalvadorimonas sp. 2012CJ34-2]